MTDRIIEIAVVGLWVLISRIWSHIEHKKGRQEIKIYMNGEMEKKVNEAYEKGRLDERNQLKEK